jgi:hypothetical protein
LSAGQSRDQSVNFWVVIQVFAVCLVLNSGLTAVEEGHL